MHGPINLKFKSIVLNNVGLRPLACWDCGFESHRGHGCLSCVSVVCCQEKVSATSWSLVLPTVVRRCVWSRNLKNEEAMTRVGSQRHRKNPQQGFNLISLLVAYCCYCPIKVGVSSKTSTSFFRSNIIFVLSNLTLNTALCLGFFRFCIVRSKYVYMQCERRTFHPRSPTKYVEARFRNRTTLNFKTTLI